VIRFETRSGSVYEVDQKEQRIRRLGGPDDPQPRQGDDGEWKAYRSISPIELGRCVLVCWPTGTPLHDGSPQYALPCTLTSEVVQVSS
jgi:hypothetical protein